MDVRNRGNKSSNQAAVVWIQTRKFLVVSWAEMN